RAARMHLTELVSAEDGVVRERVSTDVPCDRVRIFSLEGELFFGAASELEQHLETVEQAAQGGVRVLVLRVKRVRNPDAVCLEILDRFVIRMREAKVAVVMCGVRPDLMQVLRTSGIVEHVGAEHMFVFQETGTVWSSTLGAIRFAFEMIGPDTCGHCPRCRQRPGEAREWSYAI
ncbi:MAG: sodium-independent anion transporter, partial [Planctomycetes bacterium]|nr:sodium-independent anion transporter [Planctomycetota bacterium]